MRENKLVEKLKTCDENAAKDFLHEYTPLIRYVVSPILENEHDREDCISEVVLKAWKNINSYDSVKGNFSGWLTAIARNTALNYARKVVHTENIDEFQNQLVAPEPTPEEALLNKEEQKRIIQAINSLSSKDRTLFYRKYYYMQSTAQIARETGLTERAVEGRLHRAKKRLRKLLGGDDIE
ncbi:MAG: sigma-70 family RNA polymerase sigma factor [Ruminococcaceae bacterium]|nr:sigma-70 family RNA polymerase sigma factor [Oscillospiraceae bacterium]